MLRRIAPCALLGILTFCACKKTTEFKTLPSGLKYAIVKDEKKGDTAQLGDMMKLHLYIHAGDSVLYNTKLMNNNKPVEIPRMPPNFSGDWLEGLGVLTAGDSAVFIVPVETLRKATGAAGNLPPWMKDGTNITYEVTVESITKATAAERAQFEQQMQMMKPPQAAANQDAIDDGLLQDYFKKNNIQPQATGSGLYYTVEKPGSGPLLAAGQQVSMNYKGTLLNGFEFDASRGNPFTFTLGTGGVIKGWDEGVALLKKGAKAHFYIPSRLAYGPQAPGPDVPANSVMVFDVEVVDAK